MYIVKTGKLEREGKGRGKRRPREKMVDANNKTADENSRSRHKLGQAAACFSNIPF